MEWSIIVVSLQNILSCLIDEWDKNPSHLAKICDSRDFFFDFSLKGFALNIVSYLEKRCRDILHININELISSKKRNRKSSPISWPQFGWLVLLIWNRRGIQSLRETHVHVDINNTLFMWIRHVCRSCSLIFSIVIAYLWTWIGQRKSLWFVEFIHLVSLRRFVVLCFHSLNVGNGRNTWVCWWFSRTVSTGIDWLTPWAVHIYVHIHVVVGHWIGLESILISKGNNLFASSLLGATIQDGGTRERSDVPRSTTASM